MRTIIIALLIALAAPHAANAQNMSPAVQRKLARIDTLLASLRLNPQWERGHIPAAEVSRARSDMRTFMRTLNRAVREFNGLPPRSRLHHTRARLNRYQRYHQAVTRALRGKTAAPGTEQLSSRTQRALRELERYFGALVLDPQSCAGNISGREARAKKLQGQIYRAMQWGPHQLAKIPPAKHRDPRVAKWVTKVAKAKACAAAIRAALASKANDIKAVGKRRRAFLGAVASFKRYIVHAITLLQHPGHGNVSLAQLESIKSALAAVQRMCTGDHKYAVTDPPSKYTIPDIQRPGKWCEAAAKRDTLLRKLVTNSVPRRINRAVSNLQSMTAKIAGDKGWRSGELITKPFGDSMQRDRHGRDIVGMYKLVGMTPPASVLKPYKDAVAGYWAEVKRVASAQRVPRARGHHSYAERLARKRLKRDGVRIRIKRSGLLRGATSWKIQRNARRQVISRTHGGFVYYKVGRETLCRVAVFAYKEIAMNRRFNRPPGVQFTTMQFVKCR